MDKCDGINKSTKIALGLVITIVVGTGAFVWDLSSHWSEGNSQMAILTEKVASFDRRISEKLSSIDKRIERLEAVPASISENGTRITILEVLCKTMQSCIEELKADVAELKRLLRD